MLQVTAATAAQAKADAYIVGVDAKRHAPGLKALGLEKDANVRLVLDDARASLGWKSVRAVPTSRGWALLVGIGDRKALTAERLGTASNLAARAAGAIGCQTAATTLALDAGGDAAAVTAVTQGLVIGSLDFDQWKSKPKTGAAHDLGPARDAAKRVKPELSTSNPPAKADGAPVEPKSDSRLKAMQVLVPTGPAAAACRRALDRALVVARAVNDARLLANTPANVASPAWLAGQAQERGKANGFKVTVKGRDELRREGFGALCGVGQGSANEEKLITMDYHPKGAKKTLCVVGKGVCFDSGGISLKPGDRMWEMKYDKCGACNTIALMSVLRALGVKHRVLGIVPAVENLPGPTAQRPGDIVTAKDGTTIEVLNTDAEGRLILADAMTHARTFKPDGIVDMATLTGACDVAVGPTYVAAMGNDDAFVRKLVQDARDAGDKAWHLPQGEEFDEANKGTYADLQNISLTNRAGTCIGGSFIKHFAKDTKWAHLDIASKAWTSGVDYFGKGPTGAGLRIVLQRILSE